MLNLKLQFFGGRGVGSGKSAGAGKGSSTKIKASDVTVYSQISNPRGFGNWSFRVGDVNSKEEISFSGKYSDAKKKAQQYAAEKGIPRITTLS